MLDRRGCEHFAELRSAYDIGSVMSGRALCSTAAI